MKYIYIILFILCCEIDLKSETLDLNNSEAKILKELKKFCTEEDLNKPFNLKEYKKFINDENSTKIAKAVLAQEQGGGIPEDISTLIKKNQEASKILCIFIYNNINNVDVIANYINHSSYFYQIDFYMLFFEFFSKYMDNEKYFQLAKHFIQHTFSTNIELYIMQESLKMLIKTGHKDVFKFLTEFHLTLKDNSDKGMFFSLWSACALSEEMKLYIVDYYINNIDVSCSSQEYAFIRNVLPNLKGQQNIRVQVEHKLKQAKERVTLLENYLDGKYFKKEDIKKVK